MKKVALIAVLALAIAPASAWANSTLDFNITASPQSGTITYAGGANPLVGSNITVATVTCINCPLNSGVTLTLLNGVLNFNSGANTGGWTWGPGGSVTLTGGIDLDSDGDTCPGTPDIACGTNLITNASFNTASVSNVSPGVENLAIGSFTDNKNLALLNFYGLGSYVNNNFTGGINISFLSGATSGAFTSTSPNVLSGDVTNSVPEPGTLTLFGTGLLSMAGFLRRKLMS